MTAGGGAQEPSSRGRRLRAPLLIALWALLGIEALGGLVIFFARLSTGMTPGETLHIVAGVALTFVYAAYQWGHWRRVAPFRSRLDYALGLIAALALALTQISGLWLGLEWWRVRSTGAGPVPYTSWLSATHNVMSMFVLTFVTAHFGAVLQRTAAARNPGR